MRTSRAAARLRDAPVAPCPSCGRESRTVQGACADCWAPKDGRTPLHAPQPPRHIPFFDGDSDEWLWPLVWVAVVGTLALVVKALT